MKNKAFLNLVINNTVNYTMPPPTNESLSETILMLNVFYNELLKKNITIHPNSPLEIKPWGQKEFALLDPDNNLLTFGQAL